MNITLKCDKIDLENICTLGGKDLKIVVIDGQGGRIGKNIIEEIKNSGMDLAVWAIGTNSIATSVMLKAGADYGATGENPIVVNARDADVIIGPLGIVIADALLGEVTPVMATAVGQSRAEKFLLPVNKCRNHIVGIGDFTLSQMISSVIQDIKGMYNK